MIKYIFSLKVWIAGKKTDYVKDSIKDSIGCKTMFYKLLGLGMISG